MKSFLKTAAVLAALALPSLGGEMMRITLDGDVQEETISAISKIVFEGNNMNTGTLYSLDNIRKITFHSTGTAISDNDVIKTKGGSADLIGIAQVGNKLNLTLPKTAQLNVSLYSMNGRKVAQLYDGNSAGSLALPLDNSSLAKGVYSVVVKSGSDMFVQKVMVKQ